MQGRIQDFCLGGGALVSCYTSTSINHIYFFFLQNTSCIRKPQVISGGVGCASLPPSPYIRPGMEVLLKVGVNTRCLHVSFKLRLMTLRAKYYRRFRLLILDTGKTRTKCYLIWKFVSRINSQFVGFVG